MAPARGRSRRSSRSRSSRVRCLAEESEAPVGRSVPALKSGRVLERVPHAHVSLLCRLTREVAHAFGDSDPAGSIRPRRMGTAPQIREAHGALEEERSHRIRQQASVAQTIAMNRDARVEKAVAQTRAQVEEGMVTAFLQVGAVAVTDERATARWIPRGQIATAMERRTEGLRGQAAP